MIAGVIRILLRYKRRPGEGPRYALIDEQDWRLAAIPWRAQRSSTGEFYAACSVTLGNHRPLRMLYLHREIMAPPGGMEVDHRNGDPLDCRRANLRLATHEQNTRNGRMRISNTSGYKGVSRTPGGWRACISSGGRQIALGIFASRWDAAGAYDGAALSIFREFARLNS